MKSFAIAKTLTCDVAVIGGGTTGITAAIAAAQAGADTVLVEKNGCLGGNSTAIPAWLGFHSCDGEMTVRGLPLKLLEKLRHMGGATEFYSDPICGSVVGINTHWWKIAAAEAVMEAGVRTLLHCAAFELDKCESNIAVLYLLGPEGVIELKARCVIDCSDNGLMARLAGEKLVRGRERDNLVQVASWIFEVDNIDFAALFNYFREFPDDLRPFRLGNPAAHLESIRDVDVFVMGAFARLVTKARTEGMVLERDNMPGIAFPKQGKMVSVACRVEDFDTHDSIKRTAAELAGTMQASKWIEFLRHYVPGFAECRLSASPSSTGVRETSHLCGEYILSGDDLMQGRIFPDSIALGGYHLDIHSPDHPGIETRKPPVYSIPYRALLPLETNNLIMAGRVISATHEAQSSTRVIPISMAQGEAAGNAAAIAVKHGTSFRKIDIKELQRCLLDNDALIFPHREDSGGEV